MNDKLISHFLFKMLPNQKGNLMKVQFKSKLNVLMKQSQNHI